MFRYESVFLDGTPIALFVSAPEFIPRLQLRAAYQMKNTFLKLAALAGLSLLVAVSARATALSYGDSYSIGYITPGNPDSPVAHLDLTNQLIDVALGDTVTTAPSPSFPGSKSTYTFGRTWLAASDDAVATGANSGLQTSLITGGFEYLVVHYGAGGDLEIAGKDYFYVWKISGLDSVTIPTKGFSNFYEYNPEEHHNGPDNGMTAVLLGLGLVAVSFFARRRTA
jgi:hypothetical protein